MKKISLSLFILLISITNLIAQKLPSIQLDRPDQTECPATVPNKHLQLETGLIYEKINRQTSSFILPTILWKYGINDNTEFRLITELENIKFDGSTVTKGLSPIKIGFKTKICEEKGIVPATSFIGHIALPKAASKDYKATFAAPLFRFVMQHSLSKKVSLSYNLGAEFDGESPEPTFIYTLTSGFTLTDKIGCYIELYGFAPQQNKSNHLLDGGFTYLLKNNIMIDISGGFGLTPQIQKWFGSLGFSFRLKN